MTPVQVQAVEQGNAISYLVTLIAKERGGAEGGCRGGGGWFWPRKIEAGEEGVDGEKTSKSGVF